jgi:hypothetical protein
MKPSFRNVCECDRFARAGGFDAKEAIKLGPFGKNRIDALRLVWA